jgi:polysaccharide export outer membrane protein
MRLRLVLIAALVAILCLAGLSKAQEPAPAPRVYVTGYVNRPGVYPYAEGMTVQTALGLAGDARPEADTSAIVIMRIDNGKRTENRATVETALLQGDTVRVPRRVQ